MSTSEDCIGSGGNIMPQNLKKVNDNFWWVRYMYKCDLLREPRNTALRNNAFFFAQNEAQARKKVANWQHHAKHDGVVVESIESVPYGFHLQFVPGLLQELPTGAVVLQGEQLERVLSQEVAM
jgi:hypothetical protein